jgi:alpha-amylase/alpha-mannosidase (GH57 family)
MTNFPKIKDAFVTIHGHFYQPPRENPWFEAIETEETAYPFHDWNERIVFECYRPNAYARIVDDKGKILDLINNYSSLSFDFGPTLIRWLELKFPSIYQKIIEADREGVRRFGHGNAMAQAYNHIIMPLANEKDKETEVLWGIADFEKRFHRRPDAMWLPETAVTYPTLQVMVKYGMQYLILSPFQALRVRPLGGKKWIDVSQGRIDPTQPYRCFVKDPSGKKLSDQFIDIFFYDGMISKEVAFGDLLRDGNAFCDRFIQAYQATKRRPQLLHIATDGETYGHHKKFGEMALAYALKEGISSRGFEVINYGAFLKRFPPIYEVEIDEGPKGEGTSWSCSHGVGRWKEDCGCSTGGRAGWNQKWRKPLRETLDLLRDELSIIFEREGGEIFKDVWEARNGYIDVILDRSLMSLNRFFDRYGVEGLDGEGRIKGLKLLEMQRHALLMYTSCGWFFADLAGLETVQILLYAARAIQLAEELTGQEIEKKFIQYLSKAKSNLPEMGNGDQVYKQIVKPRSIPLDRLVNHYAISSLFDDGRKERKIYSYRLERVNYERMEKNNSILILGQVKVTSEIIPEPKEFLFGLISSMKGIFQTWVAEYKDVLDFNILREKCLESFGKDEEKMVGVLNSLLGNRTFTIRDIFKEEEQAIFQKVIQEELNEHRRIYAELFDKTKQTIEALVREGLEIPYEIRVAAEVTLSDRLLREVENLERDFKGTIERGEIDKIMDEAKEYSFQLRKEEPALIVSGLLRERMEILQETMARYHSPLPEEDKLKTEKVEEIIKLLDLVEKWGFKLRKEEAQGLMDEMLKEYVWTLEKSWWGESVERPFPANLILLAEKLDFNVERFAKMVNSAISTDRS